MGTVAFELKGGAKHYPSAPKAVFRDLDLELAEGELLVLLGASGCGKSTLLRCLAGLETFSAGELRFGNAERQRSEASVGIVFQEPRLMPWLDVRQNVELGLGFRRNRAAAASADVPALLNEVGLAEHARSLPSELSGGQAQRVSLARTIVTRPRVLLLDEPFGALDPRTRRELQGWLLALRDRYHLSIVFVTHDIDEALGLGDRVLLLSGDEGKVTQHWTPSRASGGAAERPALRDEILGCFRVQQPQGSGTLNEHLQ